MQLCVCGPHGSKRDVSSLNVNHHIDLLALQASRDGHLLVVVVGEQLSVLFTCKTPGLWVFPEDATLALEVDAPVGHGDVPGTLSQHPPGMDASGEAASGQHLRGFSEACGPIGILE